MDETRATNWTAHAFNEIVTSNNLISIFFIVNIPNWTFEYLNELNQKPNCTSATVCGIHRDQWMVNFVRGAEVFTSSVACNRTKTKNRKMWKLFKSITFVLFFSLSLSDATNYTLDMESIQEENNGHYRVLIEYVTHLFCIDSSYRFNHIYVEKSLSSFIADILISRINKCMMAGVLISR